MKKTLIALAVLGAAAGVAHAQSNVTIYGVVDTGYILESGRDVRMGENINNRIGFRGSEDLGGGLKATFELEKRFDLFDGSMGNSNTAGYQANRGATGKDWDGAANLGLAGNWGRVRFGRVNELTTETIRKFDPFYQYGVGSMLLSANRSARIDNTARYDSPKWSGFSFGASYSLGQNTRNDGGYVGDGGAANPFYSSGASNDGYGINLSYDNGPFMATANWSRLADSDDSDTWNVGLAYKFGPARVSLLYENTSNEGWAGGGNSAPKAKSSWQARGLDTDLWLLGLEWDIGPGQLDASVQYMDFDPSASKAQGGYDADVYKYAIGYTYNLSKRTSAYAQVSYSDFDEQSAGKAISGLERSDMWGFQIGMTHKF
ncbi:porin [Oxalobacter vibrioformis]|uniref:Porin n=1 Tax=Oxalobacter vibrioformis TaxID=933080 RepID=A0A9E9LYS4_9BURK|nr:porin [Oxalobacter vibrioformis]WAW11222.1 porin [Oxalobacter vibrioformis]